MEIVIQDNEEAEPVEPEEEEEEEEAQAEHCPACEARFAEHARSMQEQAERIALLEREIEALKAADVQVAEAVIETAITAEIALEQAAMAAEAANEEVTEEPMVESEEAIDGTDDLGAGTDTEPGPAGTEENPVVIQVAPEAEPEKHKVNYGWRRGR